MDKRQWSRGGEGREGDVARLTGGRAAGADGLTGGRAAGAGKRADAQQAYGWEDERADARWKDVGVRRRAEGRGGRDGRRA